jgi:CRP/FNR family cyclic AMP-dependent transcriptional regulator
MDSVLTAVTTESFKPGDIIFKEGDKHLHFFIVDEGQVEIFTTNKGQQVTIAKLGAGESFGEFAMLDKAPRSASARALTNLRVYKISEEAFQEMLGEIPDWAAHMLKSFARRLKQMNAALKEMRLP